MRPPSFDLQGATDSVRDSYPSESPPSESWQQVVKAISRNHAIPILERGNEFLQKRPVLVLGWISRIVVPIARSLNKHGIPVDVASFVPAVPPTSRAIREFRRVSEPHLDPDSFLRQLRDFLRQGKHDFLIPADDQALVAVTKNYDVLKNDVRLACPSPKITNLILNKTECLQIAEQCGLRVPHTRLISNSAELAEFSSRIPFPWVLKPARKEVRGEDTKSMILANSFDVASKFPRPRHFAPPMLLQEYCDGYGVGIELLMYRGECLAVFQHRRLKEVPYTGGVSVTAEAEPLDPVLLERSLALLRALQWEGPAMVEFKVDPRTGSATFMEVNGRYWGTIGLPIRAGVDFPLYQWQLNHGEIPNVSATYAIGMQWRWLAGHLWRLHGLLLSARHSSVALEELRSSVAEFPALFDPETYDGLDCSDPMSVMSDLCHMVKFLCLDDLTALLRYFKRPRQNT